MAAAAKFPLLLLTAVACTALYADARRAIGPPPTLCDVSPSWVAPPVNSTDEDYLEEMQDTMSDNRGKVVLVALTAASSGSSLLQAHRLNALQTYLHELGMSDVAFVLVNSVNSQENSSELILLNTTLTILQDVPASWVWKKLAGKKDDIFIYDRCGRLTYNIPFPLSIIHPRQQMVESALISTYLDDLCGNSTCENSSQAYADDLGEMDVLNATHVLLDLDQLTNMTQAENTLQLDYEIENEDGKHDIVQNGTETKQLMDYETENEDSSHDVVQNRVEIKQQADPTPAPSGGMWSYFRKIWNKAPWKTKEKAEDRLRNSVPKNPAKPPEQATVNKTTDDSNSDLCYTTRKRTCKSWPTKKTNHAKMCCSFYNRSGHSQHALKHCKHYTKIRCEKVEVILKCCPTNTEQPSDESNSRSSENENSSPSSKTKS